MTSISAGHIILKPTQPVESGWPQRGSNSGLANQESSALPTELTPPPKKKKKKKKKESKSVKEKGLVIEIERERAIEREGRKERESTIG